LEDGLTEEIEIRKAALEKAIAAKEGKSNGVPTEAMKQESTIRRKVLVKR
jgi:hypothetical protein